MAGSVFHLFPKFGGSIRSRYTSGGYNNVLKFNVALKSFPRIVRLCKKLSLHVCHNSIIKWESSSSFLELQPPEIKGVYKW